MADGKLTARQQAFVDEYLIDLNATQAATRAGYSKRTAGQQGDRLLKNVKVSAAVRTAQLERGKRTKIDADWVLMRAAEIADRAKDTMDLNAEIRAVELCGKHNQVKAFVVDTPSEQQSISINFGNMADND